MKFTKPRVFPLLTKMQKRLSWPLWPPLSPVTSCPRMKGYLFPVSGSFSRDFQQNTLNVGSSRMDRVVRSPWQWPRLGVSWPCRKALSCVEAPVCSASGHCLGEHWAGSPFECRLQIGMQDSLPWLCHFHKLFKVAFKTYLVRNLANECSLLLASLPGQLQPAGE